MTIGNIKNKFGLFVLIGALLGSMCLVPATTALADTTLPEEFHGDVTVNNVPAPAGAEIIAKIDGLERGNFTITEAGKYGGTGTFDKRLVVSGNEDDIGHTITFWINNTQANQTAIYEPGESEELDLSVTHTYTYPLNADNVWITGALNYLKSAQDSQGSIGGLSTSAWVVMAIAAAGEDPHNWKVGNNSIVDYLEGSAASLLNIATDWARSVLAITAAEENPWNFGGVDYVTKLKTYYDGNQIGSTKMLNDDFWGALALISAGESQSSEIITNSVAFIKENQNADHGWSHAVGGASDADNTAAAVMALRAAGESSDSPVILNALDYLKSQQRNNGGFVSEGTTNSAVDSWAVNAIMAVGQDPTSSDWTMNGNNPIGHLLSLQIADGSFNWTESLSSKPEWMTAYAIPALLGQPYPVVTMAADTTPPTISNLTPSSGARISTTSPTISASYSDAVSGINTATATIHLDGTNRTSSATATASGISYTASGLTTGTHSVTVKVSDKAGNEAIKSWSFQVVTSGGGAGGGGGGGGDEDIYQLEISLLGKTREIEIDGDGVIQERLKVTSEDGRLTIIIDEDTIALDADGEPMESLEVELDKVPPPVPENRQIIGLAYDFEPDGATFDPPLTFIYEYEDSDVPEGADENNFFIAYWDKEDKEWVELDNFTVDPENNTITAEVSHFTTFAIIAKLSPTEMEVTLPSADFSVSGLTAQPAKVKPDEPVTISVSVANAGDAEGTYTVVLYINGVREAVQSITIAADGTEIVTFSVSRVEIGTYTVVIDNLTTSFTVVAPTTQAQAPPTPSGTVAAAPTTPTKWPLIVGIIAGVIVVGLLTFFLVRRAYYY